MKNSKKEVEKLNSLKLQAEQLLTSEMDVYKAGLGSEKGFTFDLDTECKISCTQCTACTSAIVGPLIPG